MPPVRLEPRTEIQEQAAVQRQDPPELVRQLGLVQVLEFVPVPI
jgi:hypothetical protein